MINPKMMCKPPKPAASQRFAQAGETKSAAAPSTMKQTPVTGTTGTENIPPVTTPVPYSKSQTPGMTEVIPFRKKIAVSKAPTINGGDKLNTTFRPAPENNGVAALR